MKYLIKCSLPLICFCLAAMVTSAQEVKIYVNSEKITMDEALQLNVRISGVSGQIQSPRFPPIQGFHPAGTSTNSSFFNGAGSITVTQSYLPSQPGTFSIPAFTVQVKDQSFQFKGQKIVVEKGSGKPRNQPQRNQNPFSAFDDFFRDPGSTNQKQKQYTFEEVDADYFLAINLNKSEVFIGEQVPGEVVLYINERDYGKIQLDGNAIGQMQQRIKNTAFWEEIIELQEIPLERVVIKGKKYLAYTLYKTVLFPIQTGEIEFKDLYLEAKKLYVATNASPFDRFFNSTSKYEPIKIRAARRSLKVKPLPPTQLENATSVGKFKMEAELNPKIAQTGETVSLKVEITGNGNTALIPGPNMHLKGNSFEIYDPASSFSIHKSEKSFYGQKEFEYILVPRKSGELDLGPIQFYYFNPDEQTYDSIVINSLPLKVTGDDLDNLVIKSSSLDGFYVNAFETASEHIPIKSSWPKWLLLVCTLIMGGAVLFSVTKKRLN